MACTRVWNYAGKGIEMMGFGAWATHKMSVRLEDPKFSLGYDESEIPIRHASEHKGLGI